MPLVNVKSVPQHATPPANDVRVKPTIPELPRAAAPVIAMPHAAPPVTAAVPAAPLAPMPSVEMLNPAKGPYSVDLRSPSGLQVWTDVELPVRLGVTPGGTSIGLVKVTSTWSP